MDYRRDIDGLRSIAVLPVLIFHGGFNLLSGGYLGVDVFFVISGFLITGILLKELENNTFSIINFYERRARRILPALFVVLFITSIAAVIFMPPYELKEFAQSLVSVVAFVSNVFFFLEIDYFSIAAEEMPLLHTWSLAVEEQYYVFFPLLLWAIWRYSKRHLLPLLVALSVASLILMQVWAESDKVAEAFYLIFSRAWELLAGSLLAYVLSHSASKKQYSRIWSETGMVVLLCCMFLYSEEIIHPSLWTVIPVVATVLIIGCPNSNSFTYQLLSSRPMVAVGLISYSLYLWHQPILAFIRLKTIGTPSPLLITLGLFVALVLAILSYRFVEQPFRHKGKYPRQKVFIFSIIFLTFFGVLGLTGHLLQGVPSRFNIITDMSLAKSSPMRKACHSSNHHYISPQGHCRYFSNDNVTWATLGDSHIVEPSYALAKELEYKNQSLIHFSYSSCIPDLNSVFKRNEQCSQWLVDAIQQIINNQDIKNVLIGFRYSSALFGDNIYDFPDIPNKVVLSVNRHFSDQAALDLYWHNFMGIIAQLNEANKKVYVLSPIPELPAHISKVAAPFSIFSDKTVMDVKHTTSSNYYQKRHRYILQKLNSLKVDNVEVLNVFEVLCNSQWCPAVKDGVPMYFDDDHLSNAGSQMVIKKLLGQKLDI